MNSQLKMQIPILSIERLTVEFDEIDPYQNISLYLNSNVIDDDSSSGLMPAKEPQLKANRKESMAIFNQVNSNVPIKNDPKKIALDPLPEEESPSSSIIDSSFKKAVKELEYQVIFYFLSF